VGGQIAHGRQRVVHRPLPSLDPPPQVGGDSLRWPLWSPWWHKLIMPSWPTSGDQSALSQLRQLFYSVCKQAAPVVREHRDPGPNQDGALAMNYFQAIVARLESDWPDWQVWYVPKAVGGMIWCAWRWDGSGETINASSPGELVDKLKDGLNAD
jgi:hypothetical protein